MTHRQLLLTIAATGLIECIAQATLAGGPPQVTGSTTGRVGAPLAASAPLETISAALNPEDLGTGRSPADLGDPVLDVHLDKQLFEAGEPVILTTHLHRKDGADVDGDVHVWDNDLRSIKSKSTGHGHHRATLDNTPGEHVIEVYSDAVVNGSSVHRGTTHSYRVATGVLKVLDVGAPRTDGDFLIVPLKVMCKERGAHLSVYATLASGNTAVANTMVAAFFDAGESTLDLPFNQADLIEKGPYRLVNVSALQNGPRGEELAGAPGNVGKPFNATAPTKPRNAGGVKPLGRDGETVGGPPPTQ